MSYRILYVDDEPDIREVAEMSLQLDPELEVRTCSSGTDAIELVRGWRPNLVLLDVMMPGLDGPATLLALRDDEQTREIPVVFITARTQPQDVQRLTSIGGAGVIAKPFDPMNLAATVRSYVER